MDKTINFDLVVRWKQAEQEIKQFQALLEKTGRGQKNTGGVADQLEKELISATTIVGKKGNEINRQLENIGNTKPNTKFTEGYTNMIRSLVLQAEKLNRMFLLTGDEKYQSRLNTIIPKIKQLTKEHETLSVAMGRSKQHASLLENSFRSLQHHTSFLIGGIMLGGLTGIPIAISRITKETETLGVKIKQNLELMAKYKDNHGELESDVEHLTNVAGVFATGYGANIKDVLEMMQTISRRFKTAEEITYYTNLAMVMHKLDFVSPKKSAEDLESVILSMGLDFKQARLFIDQFSVAVHSARITGTDLLSGLQRSGATMKNMNLNTAEAIAMISTLSTVTAKAGANIGASLNSVLVNIDFKKAAHALKAYQIEVYNSNGEMNKGVEIWREIARVFNGLPDDKANEFANAMSGGKFRANDMRALLDNWNEFEKILIDINEKASPELTAKLLQTAMDSYQTALDKMSASLQIFGITLGSEALPALKNMTIGLTEGVQWLTKHREEVSKAMGAILLISKALITYKTYQFLVNQEIGKFTGKMIEGVDKSVTFTGAVTSIGRSFLNLVPAIALASAKIAIFLALAEAASKIGSKLSQNSQEKEFFESIQGAGSRDAGGGRELTDEEKEVIEAVNARNAFVESIGLKFDWNNKGDQYEKLDKKVAEKLQKVQMSQSLNGVNALVEAAVKKMSDKPVDLKKLLEEVEGVSFGKTAGTGSSNPPDPAVMTRNRERFALQQEYNELQNKAKISNLQYTDSLERLAMVEDVYGKSVATNTARMDLRNYRIGQLQLQYRNAEDTLKSYEEQLDSAMSKDIELSEQMRQVYDNWDSMTKKQKYEAIKENNDLKGNYQLIKWLIDKVGDLKVSLTDLRTEANKVANENAKLAISGYLGKDQEYNRNLESLNRNTSHATTMATDDYNPYNDRKLLEIKLQGARDVQKLHNEEISRLKTEYENAQKAMENESKDEVRKVLQVQVDQTKLSYDKMKQIVAQTTKETTDLEMEKNNKIRSGWAGVVSDFAIQGNSLKDIWKNLWSGLAQEAINQLFRVKGAQSSVLGNLLGFGGSGGTTSKGLFDYVSPVTFGSSLGGHATGGRFDKEHVARFAEGNKAEYVIPTDDKNRGRQLLLQAGNELGMKTGVVPYFSDSNVAGKFSSDGDKPNTAQLAELQKQNLLMQQQNRMLAVIAGNGQNQGNVAIVQVQASDDQIISAIKRNPQVLAGLMRQAQSNRQ